MVGLEHYLTVAAALFVIGIFGLFLNRKNVIIILMSVELILLAVNINLDETIAQRWTDPALGFAWRLLDLLLLLLGLAHGANGIRQLLKGSVGSRTYLWLKWLFTGIILTLAALGSMVIFLFGA